MICPALQQLINQLTCLPGIGPKSAQKMAFHLLENARPQAAALAQNITHALETIQQCNQCNHFTDSITCQICQDPKRNRKQLCIIQHPQDLIAMEQTKHYQGLYFVLMGYLSPLDGIGPKELKLHLLSQHIETHKIEEVILATNSTIEGEATAQYIADMLAKTNLICSRIAHGIPMGGELEYLDAATLTHAFRARAEFKKTQYDIA
jgi:recombination protein RecR